LITPFSTSSTAATLVRIFFHDDEDFEKFLNILARYKDKFGFKMYHFILIPNHHHFEWKIPVA